MIVRTATAQRWNPGPANSAVITATELAGLVLVIIIIVIYFAQHTIKPSNITIHEQERQGNNALIALL